MALTITNRGTFTHNTGATSFTCAVSSNCTAGQTIAICISADNNSSGGSTNNITNVTDSIGNLWVVQRAVVFDNGAAGAGVQGSIWTTRQNVGAITTGTTITVSLGTSTNAKSGAFVEISAASGFYANVVASGNKTAGATGTAVTSGTSGTINIGQVSLFAAFIEAGTTQTCTGDGDTTNGTWTTLQYAEIGSTTSGSCCASQAKLQTTANSTQTWDITLGISSDYHVAWIVLEETPLPAGDGNYGDRGWWGG